MNTNGLQSLPERRFREMEHIFGAYLRTWPGALRVAAPEGIEATTYSNKVRKVAMEYLHAMWEASFTHERFEGVWKETVVGVTRDGKVEIRPRGKGKIVTQPVRLPGQAGQVANCGVEDPRKALMCLVYLHHVGAFPEATHIQGLPEEIGQEWEAKAKRWRENQERREWNIEFTRHPSEPGWLLF